MTPCWQQELPGIRQWHQSWHNTASCAKILWLSRRDLTMDRNISKYKPLGIGNLRARKLSETFTKKKRNPPHSRLSRRNCQKQNYFLLNEIFAHLIFLHILVLLKKSLCKRYLRRLQLSEKPWLSGKSGHLLIYRTWVQFQPFLIVFLFLVTWWKEKNWEPNEKIVQCQRR